jgi:hypothetical protein
MNIEAILKDNKNLGLVGRKILLDKLNILGNFKMIRGTDMESLVMEKTEKMLN